MSIQTDDSLFASITEVYGSEGLCLGCNLKYPNLQDVRFSITKQLRSALDINSNKVDSTACVASKLSSTYLSSEHLFIEADIALGCAQLSVAQ